MVAVTRAQILMLNMHQRRPNFLLTTLPILTPGRRKFPVRSRVTTCELGTRALFFGRLGILTYEEAKETKGVEHG